MAQPLPYERDYDFQNFQSGHPSTPLPGDKVNAELDQVAATLDEVLARIALLQDDDTALKRGSVGRDQLAANVDLGFDPPTTWATATAYTAGNTVFSGAAFYNCLVSHTSGTFSTDLAAAKWSLLADFTTAVADAEAAQAAAEAAQSAAESARDSATASASSASSNAASASASANSASADAEQTAADRIATAADRVATAAAAAAAASAASIVIGPGGVQAYDADLTALAGLDKSDGNFIVGNGTTFTAENGATARASLGLTIGTDVQAYDADLAAIAALAKTDGNFIVGNGTTWTAESGSTARSSLGLVIGTDVQAYSANLDEYAAVNPTAAGLALLDDADASAQRTTLGLAIGTDVQAYDADLAAIAALAKTDGNVIVGNGTTWVAESGATARASLGLVIGTDVQAYSANLDEYAAVNPTAAGLALLDDADASAQRTTLGLGSAAVANLLDEDDMASDSATAVPSQQSVKAYADTKQPFDATLTALAGLSSGDGNFIVGNGTTWVAENGATARASLGLAIGTDVQAYDADLTALMGLDKSDGNFIVGNGSAWTAESGATARASLGLAIGTDVQAYDADLTALAGLDKSDGNFIVGNGTTWVAESGATARASLGLGTGNSPQFTGIELGHASDTTLTRASAGTLAVEGVNLAKSTDLVGQQTIWVPASAMVPSASNPCSAGIYEAPTNDVNFAYLAYDGTTSEDAHFCIQMPKGWDEGTIVPQVVWMHPTATTNYGVQWGIGGVAFADDDASDAAFGTASDCIDTGGTNYDIYISPEGTAFTVAGSPGAEEFVVFRVFRFPSGASDTLATDAWLLGVKLHYTTNAATDD